MKEDFITIKQQLPGICRIATDFYMEPRRKGSTYFVKSPKTTDKHWSLALYPGNNRFVDFANSGQSGDIISFVAYTQNCNNWTALQTLRDFYGLTDAREKDREETRRRILLQQQAERQRAERKRAFRAALSGEISRLRKWAGICSLALEKGLYEPHSELWEYCIHELQRTEYKLDVLSGADIREYPILKYGNLPSDRPKWLLDSLAILAESGAFAATAGELKELKEQAAFELWREPGTAVRRCSIEW